MCCTNYSRDEQRRRNDFDGNGSDQGGAAYDDNMRRSQNSMYDNDGKFAARTSTTDSRAGAWLAAPYDLTENPLDFGKTSPQPPPAMYGDPDNLRASGSSVRMEPMPRQARARQITAGDNVPGNPNVRVFRSDMV